MAGLVCTLCVLMITSQGQLGKEGAPSEEFIPGLILVEGVVGRLGSKENNGNMVVTVEIVHVYHGAGVKVGDRFNDTSGLAAHSSLGTLAQPHFVKGEKGIWALKKTEGILGVCPGPVLGWNGRVREGYDANFKGRRAVAQLVEVVVKTKPEDRPAIIYRHVRSSIPQVSVWAAETLTYGETALLTASLKQLILDDKTPVVAQVVLDERLCKCSGKAWQSCPERVTLIIRWVKGRLCGNEAGAVLQRLERMSQWGDEFGDKRMLELLALFVGNPEIAIENRRASCWLIGKIAKRDSDGGLGFEILVRVIQKGSPAELAQGAAYSLRNFVSLDGEKAQVIRRLQEKNADKKVRSILQEALERAQGNKGGR